MTLAANSQWRKECSTRSAGSALGEVVLPVLLSGPCHLAHFFCRATSPSRFKCAHIGQDQERETETVADSAIVVEGIFSATGGFDVHCPVPDVPGSLMDSARWSIKLVFTTRFFQLGGEPSELSDGGSWRQSACAIIDEIPKTLAVWRRTKCAWLDP